MAFEATKNFKKKSSENRFDSTERFDVDSAYVSGKLSKLQNDYSKLISDYDHTNTEMSKYVMGEKSFFDKLQAPGYKAVEESPYRERALKIKKELDLNKDFMDPESYLAYSRKLNYILDDNTLKDRISGFSEVFRERNESGISREDYRKQFEKSYENQEYLESVKRKYAIDDNTNANKIIGISEGINIPEKQTADKMSVDKEASREYNSEKARIERTYGISLSYEDYEGNTVKLQKIMESLPAGREKQKILDFSKINPEEYDYAQYVNSPSAVKQKTNLYQTDRTGTVHDEEETDILKRDKAALRQIAAKRITMDDWNAINEGNAYENIAADYKVSAIINDAMSKADFEEKSKISDEEKETLRFDSSPLSTSETAKKKFFGGGTLDSAFDLSASYDEITNGMSDEEKNVFNYILNTEGKTAATEYRQLLNRDSEFYEDIGSRKGREFYEKNLKGHPILTALYSVPAGFFGQFGSSIQSAGDFALGTTPDPKENTELSAVEAAKQDHGALYNVLLDLGVNIGDNAPSWIIGGAAGAAAKGFGAAVKTAQGIANTASAGTMFLSAGSTAYSQAIEEGYSAKQAQNYGVITGLSEAFLEKALGGIAGMGGKITGKSVEAAIKNIEKAGLRMLAEGTIDMAGEFTEEYLQEILDPVFRNITLDENNEFKPFTADALYAGMLGALSAATVNAGPLTVDAVSYASSKAKNAIDTAAAVKKVGNQITGTDAGKNLLEIAEKRGLDTSKASREVPEGRGIGKLVSKVRSAVQNRNMGKLAQDVVEAELKAAKETAMPIVDNNESLAEMVAEIATGTADVSAISVLSANGVLTEENVEKVFEALEAVQKRTETSEVRNMINDIVETKESSEGKAYNASSIYGIKREGGKTKYILEDGTEVDSGEFGLTSKDKTLFVNAVKGMTDAEANEMISAYRKYANGTDKGVFATTWGLYRSLGETGAAKNSERVAGYKSRIYFTQNAEVNNVLVTSAIEQGVKARAQSEMKRNIKARAERVIQERGRAKGEVRGEEHLGKNKSGAKNVARTLAKLGYDVEFLSEDAKLHGKRIGDTLINGAYDAETNTIYLRADAAYNAAEVRGILGHTLAHEVTHSIKTWSEADYNVLTDYIRDALEADFDALVKEKMDKLGMSYAMASDEVIADGCEMLLRDSKALEKLAMENASLFVKVASKVREFVANLRKAQTDMYGGREELHDASLKLREALKSLEEVQEVFDNALENSIRNMRDALAEAENAKTRENLDVLEKQAEKEGLQFSQESIKVQAKVTAKYQSEVDKILKMQNTNPTNLIIGYTPSLYRGLGMPSIPFVIGSGHVYSAAKTEIEAKQDGNYRKGIHYHGLGDTLVKNIYSKLQDPVMIIAAKDVNKKARTLRSTHSVVAIVDVGQAGESLLLPVEITAERTVNGEQMDVNVLSSAYTKNVAELIKEAISLENIGDVGIYYAKKEATNLIPAGVQFPIRIQEAIASGSIIRSFDRKVNRNISKNTESSQFKRWFGDWQNNPARASKAVNRDGTPKVLYHYTDNVFSIFDISRSGANQGKTHGDGIYLSSNPNEFSYAGKNRMQLYAAIFHPFEMQLSKAEAEKIYDKYFKPFHKDTYNTYKPHVIEKLQSPTRVFDYLNEAAEKNNIKTSDILGELGYDGVHDGPEWVAFKKTQVKSATDNIGTFDGANGDIYFSEETETSRDTLVSDMEAVAETDEEKSFVEKLKSEVKKANALQKELAEVNRKIKEISFTKGADRSALPSLNEEKERLAKKLNRLDSKFYGYRGYDTFKTLAERKSKEAVIAERLRGKEALRSQKEKYQEAAQGIKDTLAQREENRRRREIVRDIAKRIDKIDSIAKADSKTKHIPSALRQIVRDFRAAVDTRTQNYDERIAKVNEAVKKLEEKRSKYDVGSAEYEELSAQIEKKLALAETYGMRGEKAEKYLDGILEYYKTYGDGKSGTYLVTDELTSIIEDMKSIVGERPLYMLSADELEIVLNATKAVQKQIATANKLFKSSRSVSDTVNVAASQTKDRRNTKAVKNPAIRKMLSAATDFFYYNNLKPYELFKITGSQEMYNLYRRLQRSEGDSARLITKYADKYKETAKKNGVKEGMFGKDTRITLDSGKTIVITQGEALTLHLTQRREQGRTHLLGEGFKPKDGIVRTVENGKVKTRSSADFITLTETDLSKFGEAAGKNLTAFGEEMQNYMSTEMSKDGNAVSMALYDVELFGEDNYISLDVDQSKRVMAIEKSTKPGRLENRGFTQKTVENATQGLLISSFDDVFASHATDMAAYAAFTLPLNDMMRVINGKTADGVQLKALFGEKLSNSIQDFLNDVNGGIRSDNLAIPALFRSFKAAATGANLRVVIQQPTAIMRSLSKLNPKHYEMFFSSNSRTRRTFTEQQKTKLLAEMGKYTSTWLVKELGGADINAKRSLGKEITYLGFFDTTAQGRFNTITEKQFWPAEKADQLTWMYIWSACKNEAIDKLTNRQKAHGIGYTYEDVLRMAGDRFDEVTNETQVYDSVFARSKIMRSSSYLAKLYTSFFAEPSTTLNMVYEMARKFSTGEVREAVKIGVSLIFNSLFNIAAAAVVDAMRDDDDDQNFKEKYIEALFSNLLDNFEPMGYMPYFRDLISALKGYDVNRSDVELVSRFVTKTNKLKKAIEKEPRNDRELFESAADFSLAVVDMFGIAGTNFKRDFMAIADTVTKKSNWEKGTKTTLNSSIKDALNGTFRWGKEKSYSDKLYYAVMNEDSSYIKRMKESNDEDEYKSLIKKGLKDHDLRVASAAACHMDGDFDGYERYVNDIVKDGFDREHVVSAILSAENKLLKDAADEDEDVELVYQIDGMTATKKDIYAEVEKGEYGLLEEYYRLKVDYYKEKEVEEPEKKAVTAVKNLLTSNYKEIYEDSDKDAKKKLREMLTDIKVDGHRLYTSDSIRRWDDK